MNNTDNNEIKHKSFGVISTSKISCSNMLLYGSNVPVDNAIGISIRRSTLIEDALLGDHYTGDDVLIRIEMTPVQWAEFVAGTSTQVPCTVTTLMGEYIPKERVNRPRSERFRTEAANELQSTVEQVRRIKKFAKDIGPKTTKQLHDDLLRAISALETTLAANLPYYMQTFQECMDSMVIEAKADLDAKILATIHELGLEQLKTNYQLNDGKPQLQLNSNETDTI